MDEEHAEYNILLTVQRQYIFFFFLFFQLNFSILKAKNFLFIAWACFRNVVQKSHGRKVNIFLQNFNGLVFYDVC